MNFGHGSQIEIWRFYNEVPIQVPYEALISCSADAKYSGQTFPIIPETNIFAPERGWLKYSFRWGPGQFSGAMLS